MESKRDSKKRDAPHEVQKTGLDQSNVIQEANTSLNSNKENENDKDNNSGSNAPLEDKKSIENVSVPDNNGNLDTCNLFTVDHSKRGTAKCQACSKSIAKDELRIGKTLLSKAKHILRYLHVGCAFASFRRARVERNVISDINQLDGVRALNEQERSRIVEFIEKEKTARINPLPTELPKKKRQISKNN